MRHICVMHLCASSVYVCGCSTRVTPVYDMCVYVCVYAWM